MKNGASLFLKNIISLVTSVTKSKSLAIKSKIETLKARVIIFSLLKNKKFHGLTLRKSSISHKIHALLLGGPSQEDDDDDQKVVQSLGAYDDDDYPDLRHSLFDEEVDDELGTPNTSVIDLVKNLKENDGEDFRLEDEIDHVADLFIMKFHKRMRLQKLESFKRYQDMLERSS
uniref:uncharacterized protein LOC122583909 n=1 Tax=Erigeron canadensis TaxID=72917 RepID=UPI001CB9B579|nr:uncharacterized protein LOC122583909 [Erigeron canadensis]